MLANMAALWNGTRLCASQWKSTLIYQSSRSLWNKDWKPGQYPETREQREAAAKKYGLLPEEYEPEKHDGMESGDYPKLPDVSLEAKDPYYPYDFPEFKRNLNEPLHKDFDIIGEDRLNISYNPHIPGWVKVSSFFGVVLGSLVLWQLTDNDPVVIPVLPKQLYKPGEVHYTFECK